MLKRLVWRVAVAICGRPWVYLRADGVVVTSLDVDLRFEAPRPPPFTCAVGGVRSHPDDNPTDPVFHSLQRAE